MKRIILACVAVTLAPVGVMAQTVTPFAPSSARMASLGGPHAASTAGIDAVFENPAGFASENTEFSAASVVFNPSGPIFDIAGLVLGGSDQLLSGLSSLFDADGRFYAQADILGPLSFGYVGKGLGFGLFNRTVATVNAASLLSVSFDVSEEVMLAGGYAYRFAIGKRQSLDVGIMPKGFIRASIGNQASLTELMALANDVTAILDSPFVMTSGLGIDAGAIWSLDQVFSIGISVRDAYSPAIVTTYSSYSAFAADPKQAMQGESVPALIPADLSVGISYGPRLALLDRLGADLLFMIDYVDLLDLLAAVPRNPILNVGVGVELVLLDILSLRGGIKDALPTAGFGIDLSAFTFSLAMFGEDLGIEPGARPVYNVLVALDFKY